MSPRKKWLYPAWMVRAMNRAGLHNVGCEDAPRTRLELAPSETDPELAKFRIARALARCEAEAARVKIRVMKLTRDL